MCKFLLRLIAKCQGCMHTTYPTCQTTYTNTCIKESVNPCSWDLNGCITLRVLGQKLKLLFGALSISLHIDYS
jgi:hypothetical protein